MMERHIRVRLNSDLTKYHSSLVVGAEGETVARYGLWSGAADSFVGVRFRDVTLDVAWRSLDVIDQAYLSENAASKEEMLRAYTTARKVIKYVGPRGGFRSLAFEYTDGQGVVNHVSIGSKIEAEEVVEFLQSQGIPVAEQVR